MVESPTAFVVTRDAAAAAWARESLLGAGFVACAHDGETIRRPDGALIKVVARRDGAPPLPENVLLVDVGDPFHANRATSTRGDGCMLVPAGDGPSLAAAIELVLALQSSRAERNRLECALAYRVQFETLLTELSSRLVHSMSSEIDDVIGDAVTMIGLFTNVDRCYLFQFAEEGSTATFSHEWCAEGIDSHRHLFAEVDLAAFPWTYDMYRRLKHVYIPRVADLPESAGMERRIFQSTGLQSVLAVPVAVNRRLLGILGLATERSERTWIGEDIRMLEALAQIIANALQRKRNDAALLRVEGRFREFADLLPIAIGIHGESRFVYANRAAETISGVTREEILLRDVFSFLHPSDEGTIREHLDNLARRGAERSQEVRFFNKHGEERWAELQTRMMEFEGRPSYLLAAVDTTARKRTESALRRSEERLRSLLENMPVMMIAFDPRGTMIVWNRECERVTGYRSDEIVGNPLAVEMLYPDEAYRQRLNEDLKLRGRDFRDWELQLTGKDGTARTISWASISGEFPVPGWAYWAVGMDVTERKRLEKQVLEISAREQIRIGQDLHDRLGQLLTGLGFKAQSLADRLADRHAAEADAAESLVKLVSESISLTRSLSRGLQPVEVGSGGLMAALEDLATQSEKLFGIPTQFSCEEPVLVHDNSMATHLFRIAQEAVNNAAKHGSPTHVEVELVSDEHTLTLFVEDDGTGMDPSAASRRGLGLNIMAYRASVIDGKLEVRARPGGGTVVSCIVQLEERRAAHAPYPPDGGLL